MDDDEIEQWWEDREDDNWERSDATGYRGRSKHAARVVCSCGQEIEPDEEECPRCGDCRGCS